MDREEFWDEKLKPQMEKLREKFHEVDALSEHYMGQAIFYVEHDLADGRDPRFRLTQCQGVFNEEDFRDISEFEDFKDEIKETGEMINKFMKFQS